MIYFNTFWDTNSLVPKPTPKFARWCSSVAICFEQREDLGLRLKKRVFKLSSAELFIEGIYKYVLICNSPSMILLTFAYERACRVRKRPSNLFNGPTQWEKYIFLSSFIDSKKVWHSKSMISMISRNTNLATLIHVYARIDLGVLVHNK